MTLRRRSLGLLGAVAIAVSACGGSTATTAPSAAATPAATTAPTEAPSAEASASTAPSASAAPNYEDALFGTKYAPAQGQAGGTVVYGDNTAPANLNSFYDNSYITAEAIAPCMRGLWRNTADGHWLADLAAKMPKFSDNSIRQNADGSFEVDLALRPGLKWSDGTPLTLNDLKYTWKWVMDKAQTGLVSGTTGWDDITDIVVAADGQTATVKFAKPFAGFYGLLGGWFLPQHYFSKIAIKDAPTKSMPVSPDIAKVPCSGPYMFDTASPTAVTFKKNPNWTGGAFGQGAYLDAIKIQYSADVPGEVASFLAGDLDVAGDLLNADYSSIKGVDPSIGTAILQPVWEYEHLDMNQGPNGNPILKDPNVRKALSQAIDKAGLWSNLFPGYPQPTDVACSPAPPGTYWRDPSITCPGYDVAAANAALDAAGLTKGADGMRVGKDGKPINLQLCGPAGNPTRQLSLETIQKDFQAVGIATTLSLVDRTKVYFAGWNDTTATTKCSIYRGTYDLAEFAWVLTFDLFGDYYYSYATEQWPDEGAHDGGNTSRFSNPEMDAALQTLKNAIKPEDQVKAAYTVQKVYVDQTAEIPLFYRNQARGLSNRLQNFQLNPGTATDFWNVEDWWVKP
jgi:peptide/nickel transport system substrate-binding protein